VIALAGALGIVIDNVTGDLPIVHAIRETSVLHGKVCIGDFLVSVDEVECRGLSAVQVSRLISGRIKNPGRRLALLRASLRRHRKCAWDWCGVTAHNSPLLILIHTGAPG